MARPAKTLSSLTINEIKFLLRRNSVQTLSNISKDQLQTKLKQLLDLQDKKF